MSIGLPTLEISFKKAAESTAARSKRGVVAVILRDAAAGAQGLRTLKRASEIPTALGADNAAYVERAFLGTDLGTPSGVVLSVGAADADIDALLEPLAAYSIDYLAGPPDADAEASAAIQAWVEAQRKQYHTVKAVLPNTAANSMGVINFAAEGITTAEGSFTAAQYCSRIAGVLAGIPSECSATYAALPEVTGVTGPADPAAAVDAGKLVLIHDGVKAKIARAVNSLTTVPVNGREDWKKIKVVEAMDLITYFGRTTIEDEYIGKCANTYDNKCLLVSALNTFHKELEAQGVLQAGKSWAEVDAAAQEAYLHEQGVDTSGMTEQQIKEADTGSWVFIAAGGHIVDAMEDVVLNYAM